MTESNDATATEKAETKTSDTATDDDFNPCTCPCVTIAANCDLMVEPVGRRAIKIHFLCGSSDHITGVES